MTLSLSPTQQKAVYDQLLFLGKIGGVYNGSEQGTGKTCQTCEIINFIKPEKVLIVCPPIMRLTWADHLTEWCGAKDVQVISSSKNRWDSSACVTVTGYSNLIPFLKQITATEWDLLVLDEAHYVKNLSAKRTKATMLNVWPKAKLKIALSGTPITNTATDIFPIANRLLPEVFPTFKGFANEFCYQRDTPWGLKYTGTRNTEKLNKIIYDNFFVRYLKTDIDPEMPEKIYQKIVLPESLAVKLPKENKEQIEAETKALIAALAGVKADSSAARPQMSEAVQTYKREQGERKAPAVIEFCKMLLEQELTVVLFGYHRNVIKSYQEALEEWNPQVITGETSEKARDECIKNFQSGKSNLFIGQMNAAGVGITLLQKDKESSPNVVFGEIDYNPAVIAQAVDRCHRHGVKSDVNVYYLVVKDSIDADIMNTFMTKARGISKIVEKDNRQ